MYFPKEFVLADAINCGELIDQAYQQYQLALQPTEQPWNIQGGYTLNGTFTAGENGKSFPFGFVASKNGVFYIVIRGTQTPLEWFDDASICPIPFRDGWGNTTKGFLEIHEQIFPAIRDVIAEQAVNIQKLFVTGHSLGAALAKLTAADLICKGAELSNPVLYTFSGPRVGDATFAAKFKAQGLAAWRIFNTEDIVPTLPLSTLEGNPESVLGLLESKVELLLKLILKETTFVFQHVDEPIAVTYQRNTIPDNHNLTYLYQFLSTHAAGAGLPMGQ
jgi:triacylglycerol lipase